VFNAPRVKQLMKASVKHVRMGGEMMDLGPVFNVIQDLERKREFVFRVLAIRLRLKAFVLLARAMKLILTEAVDALQGIIKRLMTRMHRLVSHVM